MSQFFSLFNNKVILPVSIFSTIIIAIFGTPILPLERKFFANCFSGSFSCLTESKRVELSTTKGKVLIRLLSDSAPLTTGNFIDLVQKGIYNDTVFNRVIRQLRPFVVQGGYSQKLNTEADIKVGFGDCIVEEPRLIPIEIFLEGEKKPTYGKLINGTEGRSKIKLLHNRGALAMARSQDPNSASIQFYIVLRSLPELDGRYAVFGQVEEGMDVVDKIVQGDKLIKATVVF
uniref:Peptidyl-prolyl cis-trans isomerase n=1 Tax=Paulinella chromatophora TaxID=39717 RepID=B1X3H2_PAUCH|nr:probable peptidyl-prolyl cis-trans isomerase, cyclophilin type [Paulinella chromatophora]ACB42491.1 probable peptidyl-prolyl cis-trans isomerase, cyclophilin type [Paulinella chromatophora]